MKILEGLKVVELSSVLAGPSVGMFFAELGAEVIKIENERTGGDVTRQWKLPNETTKNTSAYFSSVNWGKTHLFFNLKEEEDITKVHQIIASADMVISNYKLGDDVKFKMDYKTLSAINKKLIYLHLKGFDSNPSRIAYDVVLQAESGFMSMNGNNESGPLKMPIAMIDVLAAHQMKEAALLALLKKEKQGVGSHVEVSLEQAALASLVNQATNFLMCNHIAKPIGSLHPNIAPYGDTFTCKDGKTVVLAVGSDIQFKRLCDILQCTLFEDDRFTTNAARLTHRNALDSALSPLFLQETRQHWMHLFIQKNIPAGAVRNMKEVFENSTAQAMILEEKQGVENTQRLSSLAFRFV